MEFPLSLIITDIILRDLENNTFKNLGLELPFYYYYVDTLLATPRNQMNNVLN